MKSIKITFRLNDKGVNIKVIQKILALFINATPTGELRNKLCDANIEAIAEIDKEEQCKTKTNE